MSNTNQDSYFVYVPVIVKLSYTEESPKQHKTDVTTQTETTTVCAPKIGAATSTIDFPSYWSTGKAKYRPPKYRCILAGYETDSEDDLLIPPIDTSSNRRW